MEELRSKIIELRKYFSTLSFKPGDVERQKLLLAETHEMMKECPNKQKVFEIWTEQMTGNYDG